MGVRFNWNPFAAKKAIIEAAVSIAEDAADFMAARAVNYAPIDTGYMSYNIKVIKVGTDPSDLTFQVVSTAFYSPFVEFGHLSQFGTWVAPNPFMRRALADTVAEWPQLAGRHRVGDLGGVDDPGGFLGTTFTT